MEGSADTVLLQFLFCLILCLYQSGTSSSQCLDNIPQYGSRGTGYPDTLPRLFISMHHIIPDYTFSCYGSVTQWGACVERQESDQKYDMTFSVYRPSQDASSLPNCYSLVSSNTILSATATDGCITLDVPVSGQISVEPGDVVGLHHTSPLGDNGIELDITVTNIITWYVDQTIPDTNDPSCPFRPGPGGNFPASKVAAPVITAVVASSTRPPSHSTSSHSLAASTSSLSHSTSSHSPTSSTPSPSTPSPLYSTSLQSLAPPTPSPSTTPSPSSPAQDGGSTLSTGIIAGIAVGGVLTVTLAILLIPILLYAFRAKATPIYDLKENNYASNTMVYCEAYNTAVIDEVPAETIALEQNEAYPTNAVAMQKNEAYPSATNAVAMEKNEAYGVTLVEANEDVMYEEIL